MNESSKYRRQHCLKTLFLLFKFVTRKTNGYLLQELMRFWLANLKLLKYKEVMSVWVWLYKTVSTVHGDKLFHQTHNSQFISWFDSKYSVCPLRAKFQQATWPWNSDSISSLFILRVKPKLCLSGYTVQRLFICKGKLSELNKKIWALSFLIIFQLQPEFIQLFQIHS